MAAFLCNYFHACLWMVRPCFLHSSLPVAKGRGAVSAQGRSVGRCPREWWVGREGTTISEGSGSPVWPWRCGEEALQGVKEIVLDSSTSRPAAAACKAATRGYRPVSPSLGLRGSTQRFSVQ